MQQAALVIAAVMLAGCQSVRVEMPPSDYSLELATTSLAAARTRADIAASNVANAQTTGFKAMRAVLEELPYSERRLEGKGAAAGAIGRGVRIACTRLDMSQGPAHFTGRRLDVMIDGEGFLTVFGVAGDPVYTRYGALGVNEDGELTTVRGQRLVPAIALPWDATGVEIGLNGTVGVSMPGQTAQVVVGQLHLTRFVAPEALKPLAGGLYAETPDSGPPLTGDPCTDARGAIRQGFLEGSNVDVEREMLEYAQARSLCNLLRSLAESPATVAASQ